MSYEIKQHGDVTKNLRRIARHELGGAIEKIDDEQLHRDEAVHEVRKHCKQLRGLVRLVRPTLARYDAINKRVRDAARLLSDVRDAAALVETYDDVIADTFSDQVDGSELRSIREELVRRRDAAHDDGHIREGLTEARVRLSAVLDDVDDWELSTEGFHAVRGGLLKTYTRCRKTMRRAYETPSTEAFHEWRKRAKYHRYHMELLQGMWPSVLSVWLREVHDLTDDLGDDHNLAVLRQALVDSPESFGTKRDVQAAIGLMDQRRAQLQTRAFSTGRRVFAESAESLGRRFAAYWEAWHTDTQLGSTKLADPVMPASA